MNIFSVRIILLSLTCAFSFLTQASNSVEKPALDLKNELTALDVIQRNIKSESSVDESTNVEIILQNSRGKTQKRTLIWKTVTMPSGDKKTLVFFEFPKFIKGTSLLTVENSKADDERWLYLPSIKKTRRISGSEKSDNFFGTDFSYEDLVSENILDNDYQFKKDDNCDKSCFTIVATPSTEKHRTESGYSKRELTVDSTTYSILSVDFYDKSGRKSKTYKAESFQTVNDDGATRPFKTTMTDLINDHMTIMNFSEYTINNGIDESQISLRALRRNN